MMALYFEAFNEEFLFYLTPVLVLSLDCFYVCPKKILLQLLFLLYYIITFSAFLRRSHYFKNI